MRPGEIVYADNALEINVGCDTLILEVANLGDWTIQVGSHPHFAETNSALRFDRVAARGFRLNIAAGTAVRFEPGQSRTVTLVALGCRRYRVWFGLRELENIGASSDTSEAVTGSSQTKGQRFFVSSKKGRLKV